MLNKDFISLLKEQDRILWDWNGTLLDDVDFCVELTNRNLLKKDNKSITKDFYLKNFSIPVADYYEKLDTSYSFEELTEAFISSYQAGRADLNLFAFAKECLAELSKDNKDQVLFSAAHSEELEFQSVRHQIKDFFTKLCGAEDYQGGSKLERGVRLSKGISKGLIVGDTEHDMEIGKKIGFKTVWVSCGHQSLCRAQKSKSTDFIYERNKEEFYQNVGS